MEIYYVDSAERKTVDVFKKLSMNFRIVNNILYFCESCNKIYEKKPKICECGSESFDSEKVADIRGPNWEYGIEVKIGDDLLSSLDSRVYMQMDGLSGFLKGNVALVFIGDLFKLARDNPERAGQLLSIPATCMQYGVSWINVKSILEFVKLLKYFARKAGVVPKLRTKRRRINDLMPKRMIMLMGIKYVGEKMALELSKRYRTVTDLGIALRNGKLVAGMIPKLGHVGVKRLNEWLN